MRKVLNAKWNLKVKITLEVVHLPVVILNRSKVRKLLVYVVGKYMIIQLETFLFIQIKYRIH